MFTEYGAYSLLLIVLVSKLRYLIKSIALLGEVL